jgi:WD40 repeat protein/serine/threonine protein kinase
MTEPLDAEDWDRDATAPTDLSLIEWAAELAERIRAGEPLDLEDLARAHPERAGAIRRLLPAMALMADLGSAARRSAAGPHEAVPEPAPAEGLGVLGDFRLLREVGRGGMGVVYEAEQLSLGRRVALKVLPFAATLDPKHLQRFQIEAQAAAFLHHTHIVPVHAVGCERGVHYYAMQFIDGRTLADIVAELRRIEGLDPVDPERTDDLARALAIALSAKRAATSDPAPADPPSPEPATAVKSGSSTRTRAYFHTVARLGQQAAEALEHAHGEGVLHRDIKPSNLLVDGRGQLWVTDFGLARFQEDRGLTMTGDLLGTLRYMSPEQAQGRRVVIDQRTDVYSLGVTLYELLTLRPAFDSKDRAEILRRIAEREPVPLRKLNPAVPADLETIIGKAMAKDPSARYAAAGALADDLRRYLEDRPIRARRPTLGQTVARWARRNRAAAASAVAIPLVVLVATAVAALVVAAKERERRGLADAGRVREAGLRRQAEDFAEQGRRRLVQLNVAQGMRLIEEGDLPGALPWFLEVLRLDGKDPARALAHRIRLATLLAECPKPARIWYQDQPISVGIRPDGRIAFHPDGCAVVRALGNTVSIEDNATGEPVGRPLRLECAVEGFAFHPDGRRVVIVGRDRTARVWEVASGKAMTPPLKAEEPGDGAYRAIFSPDGGLLLTRTNKRFRIWDAATGEPITPLIEPKKLLTVVFSPDGRRVVTSSQPDDGAQPRDARIPPNTARDAGGSATANLQLWDARTGKPVGPPMKHAHQIRGLEPASFSPDGRRLITGSLDRTAQIWDTATGAPAMPPLKHAAYVYRSCFSPDGRWVVTGSGDGTAQVWDASSGLKIGVPMGHGGAVRAVTFSPDSACVLTASEDHTVRIWDAATGRPLLSPMRHLAAVDGAGFSPDGRWVLTASADHTVRLWDLATAAPDGPRLLHRGSAQEVSFSPDGHSVATVDGHSARLWDVATGAPLGPALPHPAQSSYIGGGLFSPDGRSLLTLGSEYATASLDAWIWDPAACKITAGPMRLQPPVPQSGGPGRAPAWSPDSRRVLIAGSWGGGGEVRIWDALTGKPTIPIVSYPGSVLGVAFSPDGRLFATAGRATAESRSSTATGEFQIRLAATGALHLPSIATSQSCNAVQFSADGRRLATACGNEAYGVARIWDVATGRPLTAPLGHTGSVSTVAFSPDGRCLLTAGSDATACLWDVTTDALVLRPMRHRFPVGSATFSRDGRWISTYSNPAGAVWAKEFSSSYAQVWDAATGLPVTPPLRSEKEITGAVLSPDGRRVATSSYSQSTQLRSLEPDRRSFDDLLGLAQILAGTRLDASGVAVPLQTTEFRTAYEDFSRRAPDSFTASRAQILGWHHQQFLHCLAGERSEAALAHLDRVIALGPG